MYWLGLFMGFAAGAIITGILRSRRADSRQRREFALTECSNCTWAEKLERARADLKACEETLETTRKSRNALQGVVNSQMYTIKALKREKCLELGQQFFSNAKNLVR